MSAQLQRRQRVARVRRVQHLQASAAASAAEGRAQSLESTADHLMQLTLALAPDPGALTGAQLGNRGELATRLDTVRHGMTDTIVAARANAVEEGAKRLQARILQESAERLEDRATRAAELLREQRLAAVHRPRTERRA